MHSLSNINAHFSLFERGKHGNHILVYQGLVEKEIQIVLLKGMSK